LTRAWIAIAATGGFFSVAAGAIAAHIAGGDARAAELLRTGALYGMVHAAGLLAAAALARGGDRTAPLLLAIAGWCFAAGLLLFSGSLFALALTRVTWLAAVTPVGGTALLIGWAALGLYAAAAWRR
jgi:uncharacterized membrane protein YgdD (TMEM256/DUF423 family)